MMAGTFCATDERWVLAEGQSVVAMRHKGSHFRHIQKCIITMFPAPTGGAKAAGSHVLQVSRLNC